MKLEEFVEMNDSVGYTTCKHHTQKLDSESLMDSSTLIPYDYPITLTLLWQHHRCCCGTHTYGASSQRKRGLHSGWAAVRLRAGPAAVPITAPVKFHGDESGRA